MICKTLLASYWWAILADFFLIWQPDWWFRCPRWRGRRRSCRGGQGEHTRRRRNLLLPPQMVSSLAPETGFTKNKIQRLTSSKDFSSLGLAYVILFKNPRFPMLLTKVGQKSKNFGLANLFIKVLKSIGWFLSESLYVLNINHDAIKYFINKHK